MMSWMGVRYAALFLGLLGVLPPGAQGQGFGAIVGRVSSTVLDPAGEPVSGVAIRILSTGAATLSETSGRFTLGGVPVGRHEIVAELIGCLLAAAWVEVEADKQSTLDFVVHEPAIRLPGLVVGPGDAGVDAFSVGRMELDGRRTSRTLADLIRGEFPGVRVVQGSGLPGTEGAIQLRGPRSLSTEGQPLVVVDGMIASGGFIDLNMDDVEAVAILKGAAAAAEYGARGQAGVIQITTRKGVRTGAVAAGPLVLVDGAWVPGGVAGLETADIQSTELLVGAAAGVLLGRRGFEGGVVSVATAGGSRRESEELPRCEGVAR